MFGKINQIITNHIEALERRVALLEQVEHKLMVNNFEISNYMDATIYDKENNQYITIYQLREYCNELKKSQENI